MEFDRLGDAAVQVGDAAVQVGDAAVQVGDAAVQIGGAAVQIGAAVVQFGAAVVQFAGAAVQFAVLGIVAPLSNIQGFLMKKVSCSLEEWGNCCATWCISFQAINLTSKKLRKYTMKCTFIPMIFKNMLRHLFQSLPRFAEDCLRNDWKLSSMKAID